MLAVFLSESAMAEPKSTGKYKNWQSFVAQTDKGKICFAQTVPAKRAPKNIKRQESRLFVTFRPGENIKDEISITSGHPYKASTVSAKSGKNSYTFLTKCRNYVGIR